MLNSLKRFQTEFTSIEVNGFGLAQVLKKMMKGQSDEDDHRFVVVFLSEGLLSFDLDLSALFLEMFIL